MTQPRSNLGRIAIVGGGIAGLTAARVLADAGRDVTVFDKGRKPGGRLSTKRTGTATYDHGAQFFTARSPEFAAAVARWREQGVAARWEAVVVANNAGRVEPDPGTSPRYVGTPTMSSVGAALTREAEGAGAEVLAQVRIQEIAPGPSGEWKLTDVDGTSRGSFGSVMVGTPAGQAVPLLAAAPELAAAAQTVRMHPCIAVLVTFAAPVPAAFDGAFVGDSALSWVARNASKPGRPGEESWVLHGSPTWSSAHFEADPERQTTELLAALGGLVGPVPPVKHSMAFRWRYASVDASTWATPYLYDPALRIGAGGDWCGGGRVEGAFSSGVALARRMLAADAHG